MNKKNITVRTILYISLSIAAVIFIFPFFYTFISSFKGKEELLTIPLRFFPSKWHFREFFDFWNYGDLNFTRYYINSIIITVGAVVLATILSAMSGYGFAKYKFRGNNFLFIMILSTLMIPFTAIVIPLFLLVSRMGLANTFPGIILPMCLNAFGVFLVRQFMYSVPDQIMEAARIDGAGEFRIFFTIALPLIRVPLISFIIIQALNVWNELFWPLIISSSNNMRTIPQAVALFAGTYEINYIGQLTSSTFASIPTLILYIFLTRYFITGVSMTGLKE